VIIISLESRDCVSGSECLKITVIHFLFTVPVGVVARLYDPE